MAITEEIHERPHALHAVFVGNFNNAAAAAPTVEYYSIFGPSNATNTVYAAVAWVSPGNCTFDSIYANATPTSATPPADTLTYTLYKNTLPTAIALNVTTSTTQNQTTSNNATGFSVSVVTGDTLAIGVVQTTGVPIVRNLVTLRCL